MFSIISKIASALFVLLVYYFIFIVVKMIYLDIRVMSRKKAGLPAYDAYLKPINQPNDETLEIKESYPLSGDDSIGRDEACSVPIDDSFMSHCHARIFKEKDGYYIEDADSTNGTFLNGKKLSDDAVELLDGDRICVGRVEFVFLRPSVKDGEISL